MDVCVRRRCGAVDAWMVIEFNRAVNNTYTHSPLSHTNTMFRPPFSWALRSTCANWRRAPHLKPTCGRQVRVNGCVLCACVYVYVSVIRASEWAHTTNRDCLSDLPTPHPRTLSNANERPHSGAAPPDAAVPRRLCGQDGRAGHAL